jgi:group I intron endonuclease
MAYIYKITNDINGKIYIGKTVNTIEKRWNEHCKDSLKERNENRPLYKAMNKYGIQHFHIEQIEECSVEEVSERERYWIEIYGSFKYGYNATKGGDGKQYADYDLIYKLWLENKNAKEIHDLTNYDSKTIRIALEENNISAVERRNRQIQKVERAVAMLDKDTKEIIKVFPSRKAAYDFLGKQHSGHIAEVCKGKRKTAYGYAWKEL